MDNTEQAKNDESNPKIWELSHMEFIKFCCDNPDNKYVVMYQKIYGTYSIIEWSLMIKDAQFNGKIIPAHVKKEAML